MFLRFLGTSAGEQFPAIWCGCETCVVARVRGGPNIRTHAAAFLSDDVLIDFGPDVVRQARRFSVDLLSARHLFVTHCHADHLYPPHLFWRKMRPETVLPPDHSVTGPRFSELEKLNIYGSSDVVQSLEEYAESRGQPSPLSLESQEMNRWEIHQVCPSQKATVGDLTYFAVEANHRDRKVQALNYVLQRGGVTILYALDTGVLDESTYAALCDFRFDLVVMDATFGLAMGSARHLDFTQLCDIHVQFRVRGLMAEQGIFCASHISPHFSPPHEEYAEMLSAKGIVLAYDGMKIDFSSLGVGS